jgi:hypothetical protein
VVDRLIDLTLKLDYNGYANFRIKTLERDQLFYLLETPILSQSLTAEIFGEFAQNVEFIPQFIATRKGRMFLLTSLKLSSDNLIYKSYII